MQVCSTGGAVEHERLLYSFPIHKPDEKQAVCHYAAIALQKTIGTKLRKKVTAI